GIAARTDERVDERYRVRRRMGSRRRNEQERDGEREPWAGDRPRVDEPALEAGEVLDVVLELARGRGRDGGPHLADRSEEVLRAGRLEAAGQRALERCLRRFARRELDVGCGEVVRLLGERRK